ncbi:MAG: putative DNA binding domain-containing protein [Methanomassiliicoccaceae archaeon]|jgi:ATP-dependent DNA helicase RecG|nr:putative DNA binding domain-containing protein [Methanomassiliicoccaceae archaeon]
METQNMERKESWSSDWLKTVCAFANTEGGVLIIGIRDNGTVIGVKDPHYVMKLIPDDIRNKLDVRTSVKEAIEDGKTCIRITVEKGNRYIDLDGIFYKRVGSTTQKVTGEELRSWILSNMNMTWTDLPTDRVKLERLSQDAIKFFVKKGLASKRMSSIVADSNNESILRNYEMMHGDMLRNSAAILFLEQPAMIYTSASVSIGEFNDNDILLRLDEIDCPIVMQPDRVMDKLLNKYIKGVDEFVGLMRVPKYPYPEKALREAILNSICHRDYSGVRQTYVKVYPSRIEISNPGRLPDGWTAEKLFGQHDSVLTNPAIAKAFFAMGYIERFGSGIRMMREECRAMNIPEPEYNLEDGRIEIVFRLPEKKDVAVPLRLPEGLTANEAKICELINENAGITVSEIMEHLKVSESTVKRALRSLTKKGIIIRSGPSQGGYWKLLV